MEMAWAPEPSGATRWRSGPPRRRRAGGWHRARGYSSLETRLDPREVIDDHRALQRCLAVVVGGSTCNAIEDHVGGGTQEHERVESVVELRLVRRVSGDEERARVIGVEQARHSVLAPEPLAAMELVRRLVRPILAPAGLIRVHDAIPAPVESGERRRFARSRDAGHQ